MLWSLTTRCSAQAASAAVGALLLAGLAAPAAAQPEKCAQTIAKEFRKTMKTGQKSQDKCHQLANKICVGTEGVCNDPDSLGFQIVAKGKYEATKEKGLSKINEVGGVCSTAPAVLDQYPGDNVANVTEFLDDLLANRGDLVLGSDDLACDEAAVDCFKTVSKNRNSLADKMLNSAIKCMKDAAPGSPLTLPDCLDPSPIQNNADKAEIKISEACGVLTGADIGSCSPLPSCAVDAAIAEGQIAATRVYPDTNCGAAPIADARTASVDIDTPTDLGGLTLEVDYPRFAMGLPDNGSIGLGDFSNFSVSFLTPFDLDGTLRISAADFLPITSGQLTDISFDACLPLALGTCNLDGGRSCNNDNGCKICVAGSNPGANCTSNGDCTGGGTCSGSEGPCDLANGFCSFSQFTQCPGNPCPTGESCVAQQTLATCRVVEASDTFGNPVDGVTCTVALTEP